MANTYILVVCGILLAKASGFIRDAVFASHFGTGREADIYFAIFGVASLIFTAIGSALSTLVIKNVNKSFFLISLILNALRSVLNIRSPHRFHQVLLS